MRKILYSIEKIFWSIYFVTSIALIGLVMGYFVTCFFFLLSFIFDKCNYFLQSKKIKNLAQNTRKLGEYIQCYSIWFLLKIQPWLNLNENFQNIKHFYKKYNTRKIMFVANHRSNLDTFLLISLIPGLRGMAKKSLFSNLFFAPIMLLAGFVPVEKGNLKDFRQGIDLLKTKILNKNFSALVFPETTRCQKNAKGIQKLSDAVFLAAIESQALVVPIIIQGSDQVLGRGDFLLNPYNPIQITIFDAIQSSDFKTPTELSSFVKNYFLERIPCN